MKKALVVDDTKAHRLLISKCLESENYLVEVAGKGKKAMELLEKNTYDIIFLDIKMPFMSGTSVLQWLRGKGISTPVVIVTAYATVKNALDCTNLGVVSYLQKPFTLQKYKRLMEDLALKGEETKGQKIHNQEKVQSNLENAISMFNEGKFNNALECLKNLLAIEPENAEIYFWLSKTYLALENEEHAEKFFKAYQIFK
ncbi:TPR repeat-containing protein [Desulfonispora thiosulfatigenes DSM 11270]|uniref:Stage 0 sporulation protein A homolog n=1 Tax=Desulfonispora thiosulfatigenes DSM 11270 TaxID=656914 RepID=A0A1W1V163_DESTI|nr:response regulator [Desulfonispora thiosulfatigenes]SMB87068.1 TPR repeat-containing protein [Desulfonispora thiosulfatigenes DSM 11270]